MRLLSAYQLIQFYITNGARRALRKGLKAEEVGLRGPPHHNCGHLHSKCLFCTCCGARRGSACRECGVEEISKRTLRIF